MFGQEPDIEHVSALEAIDLAHGESVLLDVREAWEWQLGHAPMSVNVPMSELESRQGELDPDATYLVICHAGHRSISVTDALASAGFAAINVDGGMLAWQFAGGEVVEAPSDESDDSTRA